MSAALIGHTGFVGGNLRMQARFDACYNSSNVGDLAGRHFELVVCAGAPAAKWKANADPEGDRACLGRLRDALARMSARRVVLVSTVDVYGRPGGADEAMPPSGAGPYGQHRLELEQFVAERFDTLVVRLPALFGPGLKKNAVYDLLHGNQVDKIDSRGVFQFYDVRRLWADVGVALGAGLRLVHFATEPVSMAEVARAAFGFEFHNEVAAAPARYDFRTRHAALYGGSAGYLLPKSRVLAAMADFVAAERGKKQCA
jgi:nucleoside-diphosphate-sugar epimerase